MAGLVPVLSYDNPHTKIGQDGKAICHRSAGHRAEGWLVVKVPGHHNLVDSLGGSARDCHD